MHSFFINNNGHEYHGIDGFMLHPFYSITHPLGYVPLQEAIRDLTTLAGPAKRAKLEGVIELPEEEEEGVIRSDQRIQLITIIQMITEAARIELIAEHVSQNWWTPKPITLEMQSIFNALIRDTFTPAMATFITRCTSRFSFVRACANIDYVRVKDIGEGKNVCHMNGGVLVEDFADEHFVYDVYPDNCESKGPGEEITLTGPGSRINGNHSFIIYLSLWDGDEEFVKGNVEFHPRRAGLPENIFDKHMEEVVSGKNGSVIVGYTVISKAYHATIDVVMMNESSTNVHGQIEFSYLLKSAELSKRMLFDKSAKEYVLVSPKQPMPLTYAEFAVPVASYLTKTVNLRDHHGHEIASGSLQFTAVIGTQLKNITGEYGEVQVSITCA